MDADGIPRASRGRARRRRCSRRETRRVRRGAHALQRDDRPAAGGDRALRERDGRRELHRRGARSGDADSPSGRAGTRSPGCRCATAGSSIDVRAAERRLGRPGGAHRAVGVGRDLGDVRRRDAGARARDDRRPRLHDRRDGPDARRRLRLARALVRPRLRQPDRRRARDGVGRARSRERRRALRALLGAPRRRRQLRRRHVARVPAASGRADRLRRPRRVRPRPRPRAGAGVPRLPPRRRPTRPGSSCGYIAAPPEEFVPAEWHGKLVASRPAVERAQSPRASRAAAAARRRRADRRPVRRFPYAGCRA